MFGWLYSLLFITGFTQMLVKLDRLYVYEVGFKTLLKTGKRSEGYLAKEDMQVENKHMKRCSTPHVTRHLQIKTR